MKLMIRAAALVATVTLAGSAPARAGEPAKKDRRSKAAQIARATTKADLIAAVEVTETGELQETTMLKVGIGNFQVTPQEVTAKVVEVFKGDEKTETVKFTANVQHNKTVLRQDLGPMEEDGATILVFVRHALFKFEKGAKALVFLKLVEAEDEDAEKRYELIFPLMGGTPKEDVAAAIKDARKRQAEWETPSEPAPEEKATNAELIVQLGSEALEEREAATEKLLARGGAAHKQLAEALESDDLEVKERARGILREIMPYFLKPIGEFRGDPFKFPGMGQGMQILLPSPEKE